MSLSQLRGARVTYYIVCVVRLLIDFGINSILFQRGIYPPETFKTEEHFGLSILVSTDQKIQQFLQPVLNQMKGTPVFMYLYSDRDTTVGLTRAGTVHVGLM